MNDKIISIAASVGKEDVYIQLTMDKFVRLIDTIKTEIATECETLLDDKKKNKKAAYWEAYSHGVTSALEKIKNFGDTDLYRSDVDINL